MFHLLTTINLLLPPSPRPRIRSLGKFVETQPVHLPFDVRKVESDWNLFFFLAYLPFIWGACWPFYLSLKSESFMSDEYAGAMLFELWFWDSSPPFCAPPLACRVPVTHLSSHFGVQIKSLALVSWAPLQPASQPAFTGCPQETWHRPAHLCEKLMNPTSPAPNPGSQQCHRAVWAWGRAAQIGRPD